MRSRDAAALLVTALVLLLAPATQAPTSTHATLTAAAGVQARATPSHRRLPVSSPAAAPTAALDAPPPLSSSAVGHFVATSKTGPRNETGYDYYVGNARVAAITRTGIYYLIRWDNETASAIYCYWVGSSTEVLNHSASDELSYSVNIMRGNNRSEWSVGRHALSAVTAWQVWPGVDLRASAEIGGLKLTWTVAAMTPISSIRYSLNGSDGLQLCEQGTALNISCAPYGSFQERDLLVYDLHTGDPLPASFGLLGNVAWVECVEDTRPVPTVVDPLIWGSYLGSAGNEHGRDVDIHTDGTVYMTGYTDSLSFPATPGSYQGSLNGSADAYVARLSADGSSLVYATYLGSDYNDVGYGVAVDSSGQAHVAGYALGGNFPTTTGAYAEANNGGEDAFYVVLSADGSSLLYGTYYGSASNDRAKEVAWSPNESLAYVYVVSWDTASDLNTTWDAYQRTYQGGGGDAALAVFNASGFSESDLVYATRIGGDGWDEPTDIVIHADLAFLCGHTQNATPFTTSGAMNETHIGGTWDGFFCILNRSTPGAAGLEYGTAFGTTSDDEAAGLGVLASGDVVLSGSTDGTDLPVHATANQSANAGSWDAMYLQLRPLGAGRDDFVAGSYFGGTGEDRAYCAVAGPDGLLLAGMTQSADLPTTADAVTTDQAGQDAWSALTDGDTVFYSTYYAATTTPGGFNEVAYGAGSDGHWKVATCGYTDGSLFAPVTAGSYQDTQPGATSAWLAVEQRDLSPPALSVWRSADDITAGTTWTVRATGYDTTAPASGPASALITVDGANYTMTECALPQYDWEWSHAFSSAAEHTWSVTVTDFAGHQTESAELTLTVSGRLRAPSPEVVLEDTSHVIQPPKTYPGPYVYSAQTWWELHAFYFVFTLTSVLSLVPAGLAGVWRSTRRPPRRMWWLAWLVASVVLTIVGAWMWRARLLDPLFFPEGL